jgi:hypothetical protein
MLKDKGYDYVCISRSALKEYTFSDSSPVTVYDNRNNPVQV